MVMLKFGVDRPVVTDSCFLSGLKQVFCGSFVRTHGVQMVAIFLFNYLFFYTIIEHPHHCQHSQRVVCEFAFSPNA